MARQHFRQAVLVIPLVFATIAGCNDTEVTAPRLGREVHRAQGDNGLWIVNTLSDLELGNCVDTPACPLRAAVLNSAPGDRIEFAPELQGVAGVYFALEIDHDVTIDGDNRITLQRYAFSPPGRVVRVYGGTVTLTRLAVTGGTNAFEPGGAIHVTGTNLTLDGLRVQDNQGSNGGGLYIASDAVVTIKNSTFDLNFAPRGSAIENHGALTLEGSTLVNNTAMSNGGQVDNFGALTVLASTVGPSFYSGIINHLGAQATVSRSTIYGNAASATTGLGIAGGIHNAGTLHLRNSTVAENRGVGAFGGIYNSGVMTSLSSIVIANNGDPDCGGLNPITSLGFNLTSPNGGCPFLAASDILIDRTLAYTNLFDSSLQDNGGPTFTMALEPGGFAEDKGSCAGETADQRGFTRPVDNPLYANAADGCDIGAYEIQLTSGQKVTVVSNAVTALNLPKGTSTSLQIKLANVQAAITANDTVAACSALTAFINEVNAQAGKKKLSATDASTLVGMANALKSELGCA